MFLKVGLTGLFIMTSSDDNVMYIIIVFTKYNVSRRNTIKLNTELIVISKTIH